MTPSQFIDQLRALRMDGAFNPYAECCAEFDVPNAPELRSAALLKILERAAAADLDSIWIGRDLGYRGGRRTGLAFTDDRHLETHAGRWGIQAPRPTHGDEVAERTATVLWDALSPISRSVFLWNVFPLHPFHAGRPFSNRRHNATERDIGTEALAELIDLLEPQRILPIGRDAEAAARKICGRREVLPVRHPSYGGQREFLEQISRFYSASHD